MAANQGDASAQKNLAYCYFRGAGVNQSHSKAIKLFSQSSEQGNTEARKLLDEIKAVRRTRNYILLYLSTAVIVGFIFIKTTYIS